MDILGYDVPLWLLLLIGTVLLFLWNDRRKKAYFYGTGINMMRFNPLKMLHAMRKMQKYGQHGMDLDTLKSGKKVYGITDPFGPVVVVADKEMLKDILVKQFNNFPDRRPLGFLGEFEKGMVQQRGDNWKRLRNLVSPTFSTGKLKKMFPLMDKAGDTMISVLKDKLRVENEVDMKRLLGGYTMDAIALTLFGIEVDCQRNDNDPFLKNASTFFNISFWRSPGMLLMAFFPFLTPIFTKFGYSIFPKENQLFFRRIATEILDSRKEKRKDYADFLELMKNAQKEDTEAGDAMEKRGLTKEEIISQAIAFLAAGYDTTALLLTWLAYNLALNPDTQDKLREEIQTSLSDEPLTYDKLNDMEYLDMCINETLRLFPPLVSLDRFCVRDTEVNGIKFKKGFDIRIPVFAVQHDPDSWESPETFDPNRFSSENKAQLNPFTFLPFGHGQRNCIGIRLAYLETKVAIIKLLRDFKISVGNKTEIPPKLAADVGFLKPTEILLKVEKL